jgi:sec-independent protein translocase protein TatA
MFGIGMPELIVILVIVLVVFGAGRLPEIGSALGKGIKNFKRASDGKDEIDIKPKQED